MEAQTTVRSALTSIYRGIVTLMVLLLALAIAFPMFAKAQEGGKPTRGQQIFNEKETQQDKLFAQQLSSAMYAHNNEAVESIWREMQRRHFDYNALTRFDLASYYQKSGDHKKAKEQLDWLMFHSRRQYGVRGSGQLLRRWLAENTGVSQEERIAALKDWEEQTWQANITPEEASPAAIRHYIFGARRLAEGKVKESEEEYHAAAIAAPDSPTIQAAYAYSMRFAWTPADRRKFWLAAREAASPDVKPLYTAIGDLDSAK